MKRHHSEELVGPEKKSFRVRKFNFLVEEWYIHRIPKNPSFKYEYCSTAVWYIKNVQVRSDNPLLSLKLFEEDVPHLAIQGTDFGQMDTWAIEYAVERIADTPTDVLNLLAEQIRLLQSKIPEGQEGGTSIISLAAPVEAALQSRSHVAGDESSLPPLKVVDDGGSAKPSDAADENMPGRRSLMLTPRIHGEPLIFNSGELSAVEMDKKQFRREIDRFIEMMREYTANMNLGDYMYLMSELKCTLYKFCRNT